MPTTHQAAAEKGLLRIAIYLVLRDFRENSSQLFANEKYFDVQGCELKMFDNDWKRNEEHHKKELQRLQKKRQEELEMNSCHLHNGYGVKGCPNALLNEFTHLTSCWKVSECLSNCLKWFENKDSAKKFLAMTLACVALELPRNAIRRTADR